MVPKLRLAKSPGVRNVIVRGHSKVVVELINGHCSVRNETVARDNEKAFEAARGFDGIIFQYIPRAQSELADRLSQLATTYYEEMPQGIFIECRNHPCYQETQVYSVGKGGEDWRTPLILHLQGGILPEDKSEARKIVNRSLGCRMMEGELFKTSYTGVLLKCVRNSHIKPVLEEEHGGHCGSHIGGRVLALKIMRAGYFWPTLLKDSIHHVQVCKNCQLIASIPHQPVADMVPIVSPIPFAMWSIDIIDKLPAACGGYAFTIVVVDYFTKWVEAKAI